MNIDLDLDLELDNIEAMLEGFELLELPELETDTLDGFNFSIDEE